MATRRWLVTLAGVAAFVVARAVPVPGFDAGVLADAPSGLESGLVHPVESASVFLVGAWPLLVAKLLLLASARAPGPSARAERAFLVGFLAFVAWSARESALAFEEYDVGFAGVVPEPGLAFQTLFVTSATSGAALLWGLESWMTTRGAARGALVLALLAAGRGWLAQAALGARALAEGISRGRRLRGVRPRRARDRRRRAPRVVRAALRVPEARRARRGARLAGRRGPHGAARAPRGARAHPARLGSVASRGPCGIEPRPRRATGHARARRRSGDRVASAGSRSCASARVGRRGGAARRRVRRSARDRLGGCAAGRAGAVPRPRPRARARVRRGARLRSRSPWGRAAAGPAHRAARASGRRRRRRAREGRPRGAGGDHASVARVGASAAHAGAAVHARRRGALPGAPGTPRRNRPALDVEALEADTCGAFKALEPALREAGGATAVTLRQPDFCRLYWAESPLVTERDVTAAAVEHWEEGDPLVRMWLEDAAAARFLAATGANVGRTLLVLVDGEGVGAPLVMDRIDSPVAVPFARGAPEARVEGARSFAAALDAGALHARWRIVRVAPR